MVRGAWGGMQLDVNAIPVVVPAVILAGGQGRRIGGDKAQVLLGGVPLWRHVLGRLSVPVVAVNGVGVFGELEVLADEVPGLGPLGGVLAAMVWAERLSFERVLTVAVDTPFLPLDLRERLGAEKGRIVVAETSDGVHGTTAVWDVALAGELRAALEAGVRKVTDFAQGTGVVAVRFEETEPPGFFNVNTAEDLARAEAWL